ncbi:hypothetical protein BLNAU_9330 [Blattamonas nauphoetae]|uniref:Uncharacterized protein n=1 Tax=Blattamonas nauphoetae TaxID=2049346 RepID=A0ABQ9XW04_9EUKA|nr:hypothetical protein BLNAU_9330 [Blattamonas nauphoetae]
MNDAEEYSPFLKWRIYKRITTSSAAEVFVSLASFVRKHYPLDFMIVDKVKTFLHWIRYNFGTVSQADALVKAIGEVSEDPAAVFVDSINALLSSYYPSIVEETLGFLGYCVAKCATSRRFAIVSSKLFHRIPSALCMPNFAIVKRNLTMPHMIRIIQVCIKLTSFQRLRVLSSIADHQSIRNVVLHDVLIPVEPILLQISRNRRLSWWSIEYQNILQILTKIFDRCFSRQLKTIPSPKALLGSSPTRYTDGSTMKPKLGAEGE